KSAGTAFDGSNPSPSTIFSLIGKSKSQLIELAFFVSDLLVSDLLIAYLSLALNHQCLTV
ncbi:hypothetical protein AB6E94_22360, partial [Vibrio lentus]